jgi:hypothetical protein
MIRASDRNPSFRPFRRLRHRDVNRARSERVDQPGDGHLLAGQLVIGAFGSAMISIQQSMGLQPVSSSRMRCAWSGEALKTSGAAERRHPAGWTSGILPLERAP